MRIPSDLKDRALKHLQAAADKPLAKNALSQHVQHLLAREIAEEANPKLAQRRVLDGTLLDDLAAARKRTPGRTMDGVQVKLLCVGHRVVGVCRSRGSVRW